MKFFKTLLFTILILFFVPFLIHAQNLTISTTGQTGTSGTNWSISGSNPVIITATGTANVNTSVITGYLNSGTSVVVESLISNGSVLLGSSSAIVKNAGGDATLTFKAAHQAVVLSSITSSSSKLNIVLWSDFNNNNLAGVAIASTINTNGGHFWAGGSSSAAGSYTWNGLTVGNGPSVGSSSANNYGMDFFSSSIATGGGDILLWAGAGIISAYDGMGLQNNPHLNAGSGNVTLITRQIFNAGNTVSVTSTGKLTLTTDANNPWSSAFNWSTTTAGSNVTLTSALGQPLQINNFSSLGGLSIGVYDGFGSSFSFTNNQNININSSINIPGPINFYGGLISLGVGVEVIASTANGSMNFQGKSGFSTVANSGNTRGKLMTTGGGDITISADSDNNNSGTLDIDWLTIDGNIGDVLLEAAAFIWNTSAQVTLPEFYGTGALTIRTVSSATYAFNTAWIALFNTKSEFNLGRAGNNDVVEINPCTVCHPSAINASGNTILVAGPININARSTNINLNLTASAVNADILVKANDFIIVHENKAIRTNNGDITFWSNANGIANTTDGDFIGFYSGVSINSANGVTNQLNGGGAITIAGGTTSQTLPSGTVVPTGYAYSNRTTNWVGLPPGGVNFGANTSANGQLNTLNIYSGGGNIVIKGSSNSSSAGVQWFSGSTGAVQVIHSGSGTVTIDGSSTSSTAHGIEFNSYASVVFPTITSSNTTSSAINIKGETSSTNFRAGYQGSVNLIANGIGGGIEINGKVASASNYSAIEASGINASALSGPITFIGDGGLGLRIGGNWGRGNLTSSSSNILLRANVFSLYNSNIVSTGTVTVEPIGSSFSSAVTFPPAVLSIPNTITGLTVGKSSNTANITLNGTTSVSGPVTIYGGDIAVNESINTSGGATSGNILLKGSGDIVLAASKSITTSGGSAILWANSDNGTTNGSIALRNGSSITTGSNSIAGGSIWLGGGSDGATWNGLSVGNGYAVPGTSFTPSNGGGAFQPSAIYLERNSISSFGGNIKIAGDGAATGLGILTYGNTVAINAGSGRIDIDGQVTSTAIGNRGGILFGLHDVSIASTVNISSSATSGDAITINGVGRGTDDAIGLSGTLNITSSGGGNIVMNGNALGTGRSIVAGNYYHGILNIFANSGNISLNGNTKAVQVATAFTNGLTTGPSKINIGQGGSISSSSSNVTLTGDQIAIAAGGIAVNSTGKLVVEPFNTSFNTSVSWPVTNFSVASGLTGLRLGKDGNLANITITSTQTIAGPIEVYGGNIAVNENLNTSAGNTNGDIILKGSADIIIAATKSITTNGGDVILWANSDGQTTNGGVFFDAQTSLTTNGGHLWIGGSSTSNGSITWNGLTVGNGYAVSGRNLVGLSTRTSFKVDWDAGILLNETSINTGGGNIYLGGQRNSLSNHSGGAGIINYNGTNGTTINAGSGTIDIKAFGSHTADVTIGFLTGLHPGETSGNLTIQSSNSNQATAVSIEANNASTNFPGLVVEDETNIISSSSTNGGGISITGITGGNNYGVMVQVGSLNTLSASGKITLDGGTKGIGLHVNSSFTNSSSQSISNTGYLYMGSRTGYAITSSNANIDIISDIFNNNTGTSVNIASSGQLNILSKSNAFSQTLSSSQWNLSSNLSGLTIGKTTNTADITFGSSTTIAGPITAYGGTVTLNENLSLSNGSTISLYGNGLTIASGKTVTSNGGQLIISPQTASNSIGLGGATGTLSLPASYFSTNFKDGFSNIQIGSNIQTGNISANTFTLRDHMTFLTSGSLSLGGKPVLGNNNITLGASISSITASASNYFQTNGNGKVISTLANNASRLFPVGNAFYNGVTITNKTNISDTFSVLIKDSVLGNGDTGRQITTPHVKATWDISKNNANGGNGVDFDFNWSSSQETGGITTFVLNHHNDTVWQIASGTAGSVSGTTTKTMSHTGYTGRFSPFAFGPGVTPLPVELIKFKATCQSDYIQIDWTTASEIRNKAFELYKSDDAQDWKLIHTEAGQGSKSTETQYSFKDLDKKIGYYRLKDIDEDGIENWSKIIFADCINETSQVQVYPNPASDYIKVIVPISENTTLNILSLEGKVLKTMPLISNQNVVSVKELTAGIYIIEIKGNHNNFLLKFTKN
jgi:hypothetical protein